MSREQDQVIALAGMMQATSLVQQIATTGQIDRDQLQTMLNSIIAIEADSAEQVYGNLDALQLGLQQLQQQFVKNKESKDVELLRYNINLLHLEKKLAKRVDILNTLRLEIEQVPQQIEYFGEINSPQVIARLADIYVRTISTLMPRIHVRGELQFLEQPDNVNIVRALLLAGIRSAVLWRQKGGRRWHFMIKSAKLLEICRELA